MPLSEAMSPAAGPAVPDRRTRDPGPAPGVVLEDRYLLGCEVGHGGMGRVFAARDHKLGRDVAIKVVNAGEHDPTTLSRLLYEAHAVGALAHPNIVAIHDVGSWQGEPYLVEELVRGETLRSRLQAGALRPERALALAVQLARGLAAAHEQGIVHRDVKPENLLVTADDALKILDFGIAVLQPVFDGPEAFTAPSAAATLAGTPGYMSPEQIQGRPADARSDIFAFGTVLYEMLAGRRAFQGDSAVEVAWAVIRKQPAPLPAAVPRPLESVVERCLEKDPASRFQSARDLAFALESQTGAGRSSRIRRGLPLLAATVLLLVVGAGALRLRHPPPAAAFRQLTFHRGAVWSARFAPDRGTVYYAVAEDDAPPHLRSTMMGAPESRPIDAPAANLLSVGPAGELAILLRPRIGRFGYDRGTLARLSPIAGAPQELVQDAEAADWSPLGAGLAVVRTVGSSGRLEFPVGHVLYETSGWIGDPRFSPDGLSIAFAHHPNSAEDSGVVMISDLSGSARTLTPLWRSLEGLAWARGGTEIWFTASSRNAADGNLSLRSVALAGGEQLLAQVPGDLVVQDVDRDGRALLTRPDKRLGLAILRRSEAKPRDLSWLDVAFLGDLSADGRRVLFTIDGAATGRRSIVHVAATDGTAPVRLGEGYGAALSPEGRWALALDLVSGTSSPLTLLPVGPGQPRSLDVGGRAAVRARWFPDGERLAVVATERGHPMRLYVFRLDGGPARLLSNVAVSDAPLAISPRADVVAATDASGRVRLFDVASGETRAVPEIEEGESVFAFAADGSLLLGKTRASVVQVVRFDPATRTRTPVFEVATGFPGAIGIFGVLVTPDASTAAFNYATVTTHLFVRDGAQ